jgi:hypothetical protein
MHFVILAEHNAEVCPTSNATTRDLLLKTAPEIPAVADRTGVKIVAGPFVNREHVAVTVVEADTAEAVDEFIVGTRLHQWNRMRILPSKPVEEGMKDIQEGESLF